MAIVQKTLNLNLNLPLPPCFVATYCSFIFVCCLSHATEEATRWLPWANIRPKKACATLKKVTVTSPEAACAHISSNAGTSHLLNDEEEVEWIDGPVSGPWQDISAATDEDKLESQIDPVTGRYRITLMPTRWICLNFHRLGGGMKRTKSVQ